MRNLKHLYEKGDDKAEVTIDMREAKQKKSRRCQRRKDRFREELFLAKSGIFSLRSEKRFER